MPVLNNRETVQKLLESADVAIDGDRPWDIRVHREDFFNRVLAEGSLGLGESYMDAWWDCPRLDDCLCRLLQAGLDTRPACLREILGAWKARWFNAQTASRAFRIGERHYDLGNDLYAAMLDRRLVYSCAYWKSSRDLDEAQEAKLDLVCRKLHLRPGMRVLDIGCGWGSAAAFAARRYGVEVLGITVSKNQCAYARNQYQSLPVEFRLQDYRSLQGTFDRIFSIGMFEHVGPKNHRTFFRTVRRCLSKDGLFLLHTIGKTRPSGRTDPWISRYIFPDSALPSASAVAAASEGLFVLEDWHNFGADYDKTLMCWYRNFCDKWKDLRDAYGDRFFRMWTYYLLSCAGAFRARSNQLWQVVFSPRGVPGGYRAER